MIDRTVFRETHKRVDTAISELSGLIAALSVCVHDHSKLNTSDSENRPIDTLAHVLVEKANALEGLQKAAWDAVMHSRE